MDNIEIDDNVKITIINVDVVAKFYKISKAKAEYVIQNGLDVSKVPNAVVGVQTAHNLVTNVGKDLLVKRLKDLDATTARLTHFAVGTSATAANVADTTLGVEVYRGTITQYLYTSTGVITVKCYIPTGYPVVQPVTLKEAGLLNASAGGTLFARFILSPTFNKTNAISCTIDWQITAT